MRFFSEKRIEIQKLKHRPLSVASKSTSGKRASPFFREELLHYSKVTYLVSRRKRRKRKPSTISLAEDIPAHVWNFIHVLKKRIPKESLVTVA